MNPRIVGVAQAPDPAGVPPNKVGQGAIKTTYQLDVTDVEYSAKDPAGLETVKVSVLGGRAGRRTELNPDGPVFSSGHRYPLFLKWLPDKGEHSVVGGPQGAYVIDTDLRLNPSGGYPAGLPVSDEIQGQMIDDVVSQALTAGK